MENLNASNELLQTEGDIKQDDVDQKEDKDVIDMSPEQPEEAAGDNEIVTKENQNLADAITGKVSMQDLDDVIYKTLEMVKQYFFNNKMDEQKLAEFMFKMLALNHNNKGLEPEVLDQVVTQMFESQDAKGGMDQFNDIIDKFLGKDTVQLISDKLSTQKVDEIVEELLGSDTKKLLCNKLDNENLDEILTKLVDEKLKLNSNPESKHPNFDEFLEKILGKDTEEFIRKKLEIIVTPDLENAEEARVAEIHEVVD